MLSEKDRIYIRAALQIAIYNFKDLEIICNDIKMKKIYEEKRQSYEETLKKLSEEAYK